jgi:hypothetical protein
MEYNEQRDCALHKLEIEYIKNELEEFKKYYKDLRTLTYRIIL